MHLIHPPAPLLFRGRLNPDGTHVRVGGTDGSPPEALLTLLAQTHLLNGTTGAMVPSHRLTKGESVWVYAGPAMTRSLPPIAAALVVLFDLPEGDIPPTLAEILRVTAGGDCTLIAETNRDVLLYLGRETALLPAPGGIGEVSLDDIQPGIQILAWYETVALSLPAQAAPRQVMLLPRRAAVEEKQK